MLRRSLQTSWCASPFAWLLAACTSASDAPSELRENAPDPAMNGVPTWVDAHRADVAAATGLSLADFHQQYPAPQYVDRLDFDPTQAQLFDRVASAYELGIDARERMQEHGFVVVERFHGGFTDSYFWAYQRDLPVMITADSLLHAWHSSYDTLLSEIEGRHLQPALERSLTALHRRIADTPSRDALPPSLQAALREADVFTTVALSLLRDEPVTSALGDEMLATRAATLRVAIDAAAPFPIVLGGTTPQLVDFSQFTPRGRYTDSDSLRRYFRAMQWLARARMRVVDHDPSGAVMFDRAALDTAVVLGGLMHGLPAKDSPMALDEPLRRLVGAMDGPTFVDVAALVPDWVAYAAMDDVDARRLVQARLEGRARIDPQGAFAQPDGAAPIDVVAFPQRYSFDSRVLQAVTYDRVTDGNDRSVRRMLPSELDVMFVLGSNVAGDLLDDELLRWGYQDRLHALRQTAESLDDTRWNADVVHGWLDTIAALGDTSQHDRLPQAMRTRAWSHRVLEAQLASWAELRRDNVLYIKPSETLMIGCEFPSAYVEPVPAFFVRLQRLAAQGLELDAELRALSIDVPGLRAHFEHWRRVTVQLGEIVDAQLAHTDRTPAQRKFLRQLIEIEEEGYGERIWDGWFPQLYLHERGWEADPVVVDVHTSAQDEHGGDAGLVLHVGTGAPRDLVVAIDDGDEARTYVGPVSTFRRDVTRDFRRHTEDDWSTAHTRLRAAPWQEAYAPVPPGR